MIGQIDKPFVRADAPNWAPLNPMEKEFAFFCGAMTEVAMTLSLYALTCGHLEGELANLTCANLEGALLGHAHLEGADLTRAHLEGADLWAAMGLADRQLHPRHRSRPLRRLPTLSVRC
jgi:hypothetical protein